MQKIYNCAKAVKEQEEDHETEPTVEDIALEISAMGAYLDRVQRKLQLEPAVPICTPLEPCRDVSAELKSSSQPVLQNNSRRLEHQLSELELSVPVAEAQLLELNERHCQLKEQQSAIRRDYEGLHSFQLIQDREFALCRQRYAQLQQIKATWSGQNELTNSLKESYKMARRRMTRRRLYVPAKIKLWDEMKYARHFSTQIVQNLFIDFRRLEQNVEYLRMPPPDTETTPSQSRLQRSHKSRQSMVSLANITTPHNWFHQMKDMLREREQNRKVGKLRRVFDAKKKNLKVLPKKKRNNISFKM